MPPHIGDVTQDAAPDDDADPRSPARVSSGVGAVLGIAVALLLLLLPGGGAYGARLQPGLNAAAAGQHATLAPDRASEAQRSLHTPRHPDFGGGLAPASAWAELDRIAPAAAPRRALARAQRPGRWLSTARARAPPLA